MSCILNRLVILGRVFPRRNDALFSPAYGSSVDRAPRLAAYPWSFDRPATSFARSENSNAHSTMVMDPDYSGTVVGRGVLADWPSVTEAQYRELIDRENRRLKTAEEVCDDFRTVTAYAKAAGGGFAVVDAALHGLRERLAAVLPTMADNQLMTVLRLISLWDVDDLFRLEYMRLWSLLDAQCIKRSANWTTDKLLLYMDHWYIMNLSRLSKFVQLGVNKLAREPCRLTPKQLVQMMFYASTNRRYLSMLPMHDIEQHICLYYNQFTIKELSIVSLGFFKTQTPIQSEELVTKLYTSMINQITNIDSYELAAFLKILRYCTKHRNAEYMCKLMDLLVAKVDEVNLMCCTHMALLSTNVLIRHEELLKKISQRMVDNISQARIKDIERVTLVLTMLNYNPHTTPCIFEVVVNELRKDTRNIDFEMYTNSYISTISYLAVIGIFPYDCISKSLEYQNLVKCYGNKLSKFTVPQNILNLNNSLLIECPDYSGPLLPVELNEFCNEDLTCHIPTSSTITKKASIADRNFLKLHRELLLLFKNEAYLHVCFPLPHHPRADILFCIDTSTGRPVIIPENIRKTIAFNEFKKLPALGKWFVIMVLARNSILLYSDEHNGLTECKIRQLKKLGYELILWTKEDYRQDFKIQTNLPEKLKAHGIVLS